jgi:hypothetical protein
MIEINQKETNRAQIHSRSPEIGPPSDSKSLRNQWMVAAIGKRELSAGEFGSLGGS